jgi:hypothetical protein
MFFLLKGLIERVGLSIRHPLMFNIAAGQINASAPTAYRMRCAEGADGRLRLARALSPLRDMYQLKKPIDRTFLLNIAIGKSCGVQFLS